MSFFLLSEAGDHRDLHSFPTRRSSDLGTGADLMPCRAQGGKCATAANWRVFSALEIPARSVSSPGIRTRVRVSRSEEHTSELQSRQYLVCRLLLEKKKTTPDI